MTKSGWILCVITMRDCNDTENQANGVKELSQNDGNVHKA